VGGRHVGGKLATLLNLPGWLIGISPYSHLPWVPGETATAEPLVPLLAVVGVLGLRRRDLVGRTDGASPFSIPSSRVCGRPGRSPP
jgi:hypothetical protein